MGYRRGYRLASKWSKSRSICSYYCCWRTFLLRLCGRKRHTLCEQSSRRLERRRYRDCLWVCSRRFQHSPSFQANWGLGGGSWVARLTNQQLSRVGSDKIVAAYYDDEAISEVRDKRRYLEANQDYIWSIIQAKNNQTPTQASLSYSGTHRGGRPVHASRLLSPTTL